MIQVDHFQHFPPLIGAHSLGLLNPSLIPVHQPPDRGSNLPVKEKSCGHPRPLFLGVLTPCRREVLLTRAMGLLDQNLVLSGLPSFHTEEEPPLDCLPAQHVPGALKDHFLEDDEQLKILVVLPDAGKLCRKCVEKVIYHLPHGRGILLQRKDRKVLPPYLPPEVIYDPSGQVYSAIHMNPVSVNCLHLPVFWV